MNKAVSSHPQQLNTRRLPRLKPDGRNRIPATTFRGTFAHHTAEVWDGKQLSARLEFSREYAAPYGFLLFTNRGCATATVYDDSLFSTTLCCSLNNLSDSRWPPVSLRSRERHANRGLKSWVHPGKHPATKANFSRCTSNALPAKPVHGAYNRHSLPFYLVVSACIGQLVKSNRWTRRFRK